MEQSAESSAICLYWLWYLYKYCGAASYYGEESSQVAYAAKLCTIPTYTSTYIGEMRLAGEKGVDLSVQYPLTLFAQGNPFPHNAFIREAEFFRWYGEQLQSLNPTTYQANKVYLEVDTSRGEAAKAAVFIHISGAIAERLTPEIALRQGVSKEILAARQYLIERVTPHLELYYYGFMHSRTQQALRLTFLPAKEGDMGELLTGLDQLPPFLLTDKMRTLWQEVAALGIFRFFFDLDILPDGTMGDTVGLQLLLPQKVSTAQKDVLAGEAYRKFVELLKDAQMADERIETLPQCLWGRRMEDDEALSHIYLYSTISHFKLQWRAGKALPAKVYLQLLPVAYQESINEGLNAMRK